MRDTAVFPDFDLFNRAAAILCDVRVTSVPLSVCARKFLRRKLTHLMLLRSFEI